MILRAVMVVCLLFYASSISAVEPDEILSDPALETRARTISKDLRCLVCRNENIDSSDAGIARDLRLLVRERLLAGDSNAQVIDYIVQRYGEYVLLRPPVNWSNLILYISGPVAFFIGVGVWALSTNRRRQKTPQLTPQERKRLQEMLKDHDS